MVSWLQCFLPLLLSFSLTRGAVLPAAGGIFEGDVIVTPNLIDYANGTTSEKREYHANAFLWNKDGDIVKIPYTIKGLDDTTIKNLKLAFHAFKGLTCIQFVPRNGQEDYIEFSDGSGSCASSIGRKGGLQNLYIGSACKSLSTILHEMMHAIGFLHEHTREDRDNYIELKFENIKPGFEDQFQTYSVQNFGYEYDLYSLMHYRLTEFSRNGLHTIESKSNPNDRLGNNEFFTKIDLKQINSLYNCPSKYLKLEDYEIIICTSNKWYAATGATVYLDLKGDGLDTSGEFIAGKSFDGDSQVKIKKIFPHMSMKKLLVRHDNTGWGAGWHLDKIIIKNKTTGEVVTFKCYCWIEGVSTKTLTP